MKSKSFSEYCKLPRIENRFRPARSSDRQRKPQQSSPPRPRAYSEIDRKFEIERSNKLLADKLIHIANRKSSYKNKSISITRRLQPQESHIKYSLLPGSKVPKGKSSRIEIKHSKLLQNRRQFLKLSEKNPNFPSLISKKITSKSPGQVTSKKIKTKQQVFTEFTLEDDSSIED